MVVVDLEEEQDVVLVNVVVSVLLAEEVRNLPLDFLLLQTQ